MLTDVGKLVEVIKSLLSNLFNGEPPRYLLSVLSIVTLCGLCLCGIWGLLYVVAEIRQLWNEKIAPIFYDREQRVAALDRQRFAQHVEAELNRLDSLTEWKDYRYGELEAEVEAEGSRRTANFPFFSSSTYHKLRRERSLTKALRKSRERIILLEGDPGAGKSVALRHLAQVMARKAAGSRSKSALIPIYVNLRELERQKKGKISSELVRKYIIGTLNRANDRDVDRFLERSFDEGVKSNKWLFLFDSFDEIPDILSSSEADNTVRSYTEALSDFLHGWNTCRGVVASRQFRGPASSNWPKFQILALTEKRQRQIIRRANLTPTITDDLIGRLTQAAPEIQSIGTNPMFLGLLCEHVRDGHKFPEAVHYVFESFIDGRLRADSERLSARFHMQASEVREAAETVAFCMTVDEDLGLSPAQDKIAPAVARADLTVNLRKMPLLLSALEYLKFAKIEAPMPTSTSATFTFAHRRFQEYFATCVVLRRPELVSASTLLSDARWRESAVVLCQTHGADKLGPLLDNARIKLVAIWAAATEVNPRRSVSNEPVAFNWPSGSLHLLSLLQDGFVAKPDDLPSDVRSTCADLLEAAFETNFLSDQRWAIEVAGVMPESRLASLLRLAFASSSEWLRDATFRQTSKLHALPDDIKAAIRRSLLEWIISKRITADWYATKAQIVRLQSQELLDLGRLSYWFYSIDVVACASAVLFTICRIYAANSSGATTAAADLLLVLFALFSLSSMYTSGRINRNTTLLSLSLIRILLLLTTVPAAFIWAVVIGPPTSRALLLYLNADISGINGFLIGAGYALAVYGLLWAPLSLISASTSHSFESPFLWILKPLSGITALIRTVPARVLTYVRDRWLRLALMAALAMVLEFIFILIVAMVPTRLGKWINSSGWSPGQFIAFLFFPYCAVVGMIYLIRVWSDERVLRQFIDEQSHLNEKAFVAMLRRFRSPKRAAQFCRLARDKSLILLHDDTGHILLRELDQTKPSHSMRRFRAILIKVGFLDPVVIPLLHPDVLDEVFKIIEAKRRLVPNSDPLSVAPTLIDDARVVAPLGAPTK